MSSRPRRVDANVLPGKYRRRWLTPRQILFIVALVAVIALAFPLYLTVSATMGKTSDLQGELDVLKQQAQVRKIVLDRRAQMLRFALEYESIRQKRGVLTEELKAITSAAEGLSIQIASVAQQSNSVTISCRIVGSPSPTTYYEVLNDYCEALEQTGRFASARYPISIWPPPAAVTIEAETATPAASP